MVDKRKQYQTAVHESGHAVVAKLLDFPINTVRVNGSRGGVCLLASKRYKRSTDQVSQRTRMQRAKKDLLVDVAGYVAEAIFGGKRAPEPGTISLEWWPRGAANLDDSDLAHAHSNLSTLAPNGPVPAYLMLNGIDLTRRQVNYMNKAITEAAEMLRESWPTVTAIANRLTKRYLRGEQIDQIFDAMRVA